MKTFLRSLTIWIGMMVIAIANGAFRESVLRNWLDELPAHQISTLLLIALHTLFTALVIRRKPFDMRVPPLVIGFTARYQRTLATGNKGYLPA